MQLDHAYILTDVELISVKKLREYYYALFARSKATISDAEVALIKETILPNLHVWSAPEYMKLQEARDAKNSVFLEMYANYVRDYLYNLTTIREVKHATGLQFRLLYDGVFQLPLFVALSSVYGAPWTEATLSLLAVQVSIQLAVWLLQLRCLYWAVVYTVNAVDMTLRYRWTIKQAMSIPSRVFFKSTAAMYYNCNYEEIKDNVICEFTTTSVLKYVLVPLLLLVATARRMLFARAAPFGRVVQIKRDSEQFRQVMDMLSQLPMDNVPSPYGKMRWRQQNCPHCNAEITFQQFWKEGVAVHGQHFIDATYQDDYFYWFSDARKVMKCPACSDIVELRPYYEDNKYGSCRPEDWVEYQAKSAAAAVAAPPSPSSNSVSSAAP